MTVKDGSELTTKCSQLSLEPPDEMKKVFYRPTVKIWVNFGKYSLSSKEYYEMEDQGIVALEKMKSIKENAINFIFCELSSPVDTLFSLRYQTLPKFKSFKFLKYILDMLNPFILGKQIKNNNLSFGDIDKIKLITKYTNELSNSDLVILMKNHR